MKVVGVIGCGGKVGREICRLLSGDFRIKGGQRHQPEKLLGLENFYWEQLDLYDQEQLEKFCRGCGMIINCAGPAYIISRHIAEASAAAGSIYLDVSDALAADPEFGGEKAKSGEFIIAAGYNPGLVGCLLRNICNRFDKIDWIRGISGGDEKFTAISLIDIVQSADSGLAMSNSRWEDEKFHSVNENIVLSYCDAVNKKVYRKRFISNEIAVLLKEIKVGKLEWFDISENNSVGMAAMKYYNLRNKYSGNEMIRRLTESMEKFAPDEKKTEWHILDITAEGEKEAESVTVHVKMQLGGTYLLTALCVAQAARAVFEEKRTKGVRWANEFLSMDIISKYREIDERFVFEYNEEFEI